MGIWVFSAFLANRVVVDVCVPRVSVWIPVFKSLGFTLGVELLVCIYSFPSSVFHSALRFRIGLCCSACWEGIKVRSILLQSRPLCGRFLCVSHGSHVALRNYLVWGFFQTSVSNAMCSLCVEHLLHVSGVTPRSGSMSLGVGHPLGI